MSVEVGTPTYWILKLLIAAPGAYVFWRAYRAYRKRRTDPSVQRDPTTDRWWRIIFIGGATLAGSLLAILIAPKFLVMPLFVILAGGTILAFIGAFMIGWRSI